MRPREPKVLDGFQHCRKPWLVRTLPGVGPEVSSARLVFITAPVEARKPRQHPQASNDPIRTEFKADSNRIPCLPCSTRYFVKY